MTELKRGSTGPDVVVWQNFLTSRNLHTKPDGDFGPNTEANTRIWQQRAGLQVTGMLDFPTMQKATNFGYQYDALSLVIGQKNIDAPTQSAMDLFPDTWDENRKANESKLAKVSPVVADRARQFIALAQHEGITLRVVQGLRTFAEQDSLYAQGRSKAGKVVTNAKGGQSLHNYGLAVDLAPIVHGEVNWEDSRFKAFGTWAIKAGLDWGGSWKTFKDLPHVQDTDHMNLAKVQQLYRTGGLANVWANIT